ncbi:MAG: hypothetical protein HQK60_00420 [Deltaproteobacteria bacterium]|nr:hypothetical protein [Deltaproteobacteria bacterium]
MAKTLYDVERIQELHPKIRAQDWRSPLVSRLQGRESYCDGSTEVSINYRSMNAEAKCQESEVMLRWSGLEEDYKLCINTYQGPTLTEFATLGLACILVAELPHLEITEVARRGERADYWLGDKELLLEVSGQVNGSLSSLRDDKAKQLQANPFGKAGYVCVANYSEAASYLWYYEGSNDIASPE